MRLRAALFAITLAAFGYAAAVGVAVPTTLYLMQLSDRSFMGNPAGAGEDLASEYPTYLLGGALLTVPTALPGYILVLNLSWRNRWRHWLAYAVAGSVNALAALLIFHAYSSTGWWPQVAVGFVLACMGGGFAGGAAYWLFAGRWRERLREKTGS